MSRARIDLDLPSQDQVAPELPEFDAWSSRTIAQLGQDLNKPTLSLMDQASISDLIDLAFIDQLTARGIGHLFTFEQQCDAELLQNLIPRVGHELENSNSGRVAFGQHSDDSILNDPFRVENLVLLGVDNPDAVPTHLCPLDEILRRLDPRTIRVLCEDRFVFGCPESFTLSTRSWIQSPLHPILRDIGGCFEIRFASYSTTAPSHDTDATAALAALNQAVVQTPPVTVVLHSGVFVTFSNSRYLHSRGQVNGRRWVKRSYVKRDLSALIDQCGTPATAIFDLVPAIHASTIPNR